MRVRGEKKRCRPMSSTQVVEKTQEFSRKKITKLHQLRVALIVRKAEGCCNARSLRRMHKTNDEHLRKNICGMKRWSCHLPELLDTNRRGESMAVMQRATRRLTARAKQLESIRNTRNKNKENEKKRVRTRTERE